jgi:predicted phosphodiesterase
MTTAERDAEIFSLRQQGKSYAWIADEYDLPLGTVYRIMHYQRKHRKPQIKPSQPILRRENADTDAPTWTRRFDALSRRKRFVTTMHLSDIHFPFHDEAALALTYKIVQHVQPDVIVVGSDAFDLPTISRFEPDRDLNVDDWLDQIQPYWRDFIHALRTAAPDALLPFIFGNHDVRALAEIKKLSVPKIAMRHFVDTIRNEREVLYLGDTQEVDVGNLTVAHGWKTTRYTAAATLQAYQNQRNVAVGHTHRPDYYTVRGASYSVACVVGGCLCQLTPHYQQGRKHTDWQHGTMLGIVDTAGSSTALQSIVYHDSDGGKWASVGTHVIEATS